MKSQLQSITVCTSSQALTFIHSSFGLVSTGFIRLRWKTKINCQVGSKTSNAKLKIRKQLREKNSPLGEYLFTNGTCPIISENLVGIFSTFSYIIHQDRVLKTSRKCEIGLHNKWPQEVETARPSNSLQQALHLISTSNVSKYLKLLVRTCKLQFY